MEPSSEIYTCAFTPDGTRALTGAQGEVTTVFKDGVGYDSPKLLAAVKGRVGID